SRLDLLKSGSKRAQNQHAAPGAHAVEASAARKRGAKSIALVLRIRSNIDEQGGRIRASRNGGAGQYRSDLAIEAGCFREQKAAVTANAPVVPEQARSHAFTAGGPAEDCGLGDEKARFR